MKRSGIIIWAICLSICFAPMTSALANDPCANCQDCALCSAMSHRMPDMPSNTILVSDNCCKNMQAASCHLATTNIPDIAGFVLPVRNSNYTGVHLPAAAGRIPFESTDDSGFNHHDDWLIVFPVSLPLYIQKVSLLC